MTLSTSIGKQDGVNIFELLHLNNKDIFEIFLLKYGTAAERIA